MPFHLVCVTLHKRRLKRITKMQTKYNLKMEKINLSPESQRIKIFMESEGISNRMLADSVNMTEPSISKILSGKTVARRSTLKKICEAYPKLNLKWLITGEGEMLQEPGQSTINWKEEAYQLIKDENTFLKRQLETLTNALNAVLKSQNPNFRKANLQAAKFILESQGTLAGGLGLRKVA